MMRDVVIHPIDVLLKKRDGEELSTAEIEFVVRAVVRGNAREDSGETAGGIGETISDAQIGAFLMAVFERGLSLRELGDLTRAMRFSGETFDASVLETFTLDKHSTRCCGSVMRRWWGRRRGWCRRIGFCMGCATIPGPWSRRF
jgi:thymidine phosphorylase